MTIYLLLAKSGPNDQGKLVDIYASKEKAEKERQRLEQMHSAYIGAINRGEDAQEPPFFVDRLVVEERAVK